MPRANKSPYPPIIYEDNHLLAINKPFGMLSQGDPTGDQNVVDVMTEYLRVKYNKPGNIYCALLHRLDRPVGGLLLLAKTSKAAARMSEQFKERKVKKTYLAITEEIPFPMEGELKHYLKKVQGRNIVKALNKPEKDAQEAVLFFRVLKTINHRALISVEPHTGRQHQIRVQLAKIDCPLVGDVKYGDKKCKPEPDHSIALFSHKLRFEHPTTKEIMELTAPPPKQLAPWQIFEL